MVSKVERVITNRIKELRTAQHMTQEEVAKQCDVTDRCVSNWELGIREPKLKKWLKLSEIFNVSVTYVMGIDNRGNQA